jgi:sugar phosphate isomerase/epimerase
MHTWMRVEPLELTAARLARFGYDAIQIAGEPQHWAPSDVAPLLQRHKIRCCGTVTIMTAGRDLISPDPSVRRRTVQYLRDCITMAHGLGGEFVCVVPGTVGKTLPQARPEEEWRWAVEGLSRCAEWAEQSGLKLGIEPINRFETYFINRADQAIALADAVGSPCVGVVLDAFHLNIEEADPLDAIRRAGPRLVDFHVADTNRRPPGEGAYDWDQVIAVLREIGYTGYLSSEFLLPIDRTPLGRQSSLGDQAVRPSDDPYLVVHASGDVSPGYYDRCVEHTAAYLRSVLSRARVVAGGMSPESAARKEAQRGSHVGT